MTIQRSIYSCLTTKEGRRQDLKACVHFYLELSPRDVVKIAPRRHLLWLRRDKVYNVGTKYMYSNAVAPHPGCALGSYT